MAVDRPRHRDRVRRETTDARGPTCREQDHDLFRASVCAMAQDGTQVFLLCYCGQARCITRAEWETLAAHRDDAGRYEARERKDTAEAQGHTMNAHHAWHAAIERFLQRADDELLYTPESRSEAFRSPPSARAVLYILDGHTPVPAPDIDVWMTSFAQTERRRVARTTVAPAIEVSTVFLGSDYNCSGEGPPLLFQTFVFGGPCAGAMARCHTWDEAEEMHQRMVDHVHRVLRKTARP